MGRATILVCAAACALLAAATPATAGLRAGCDAQRPAVAYTPGGGALAHQPSRRPIPCLTLVAGRTSESAMVALTRAGRLLYAPLVDNSYPAPLDDRGPALVSASDDGGAHWQTLDSGGSDHILDVPPWMARDPSTGRIWFATVLPGLCGAEVSWSDDDGRSWRTNHAVGCPGMGSMRILEGPPPTGGARPAGYPHVVYYCANLSDFNQSNLWCYRSLDGGRTFLFTGGFADPPPKPGCGTEHPARPGAVGPDGNLYFPVYQCGDLSVAISRDEGATWQLVHVATSNVSDLYISSLAADDAGNLYLAWNAATAATAPSRPGAPNTATEGILGAGTPMLAVSRDRGRSWSQPVSIAPPGAADARHIAVAATGSGSVAVSLLASSDGGAHLNGYLVETPDALARTPLWWGAPLNDPATPLISTADSETFGDRLFNFTDTFAPDGTAWAAFHCAKTSACPGERIGVLGRLAPSPAPPPPPGRLVAYRLTGRCTGHGRLRIRVLLRPALVARLIVRLNGRRIVVTGARLRAPLVVGRLPRGRVRMALTLVLIDGRMVVLRRDYRRCVRSQVRGFTARAG